MKQTNKTVFAFVFAAAAIILVGAGGEGPAEPQSAQPTAQPLSLGTDAPIAPVKHRDLIA